MKRFVCTVCGYVYEGDSAPDICPVCKQPGEKFREETAVKNDGGGTVVPSSGLDYDKNFYRNDSSCRYMEEIHQMAVTGKSLSSAMGTKRKGVAAFLQTRAEA